MVKAYVYLLAAAFFWGTSFVAGKYAFDFADPVIVVFFRFLIASAFWFPKVNLPKLSLQNNMKLVFISFLIVPATFLLQFIGLKYTSASSAAIMIGFEPLMIVFMGWLIWKERPSFLSILLAFIALIGVLLVIGWPSDAKFLGSTLVLLSTVIVAIWVRWSKEWMSMLGVKTFTALTTIVGTFLLIPFAIVFVKKWDITYSWSGLLAILYLGIGCSLFANWAWNNGISNVSANVGGLFLSLEPIFGIIIASYLLQELLTTQMVIGAALVIFPVVISALISFFSSKTRD